MRAKFWRAQGFPNLVLARKARWPASKATATTVGLTWSPFAIPDDLPVREDLKDDFKLAAANRQLPRVRKRF